MARCGGRGIPFGTYLELLLEPLFCRHELLRALGQLRRGTSQFRLPVQQPLLQAAHLRSQLEGLLLEPAQLLQLLTELRHQHALLLGVCPDLVHVSKLLAKQVDALGLLCEGTV